MPYIFCLLVDLASTLCCAWLGYLVYNGATKWLIPIMILLAFTVVMPSRDIFKCPKCGWVDEVKVYKVKGLTVGVQKSPDEAQKSPEEADD